MRVTVFGAAGRTGRHVVAQALRKGYEVTASVRDQARLDVIDLIEEVVSEDPLRVHLEGIGRGPPMTSAQERDLLRRMEAGRLATGRRALSPRADVESELGRLEEDGRLAKQELLEANLRLVVSLAARYRGRGMTFLDLVAAGSAGLVRAISSFDQSSRDRFTGRAEWYVRRAIARAVEDRAAGTTSVPITRLDVVNGDARDAELVEGAVAGRDGLISVLALPSGEREFEHSEATSVIVGAALRSSVRRVIVTTCADVFSDGEVTGDRAPYAREDERNRDELRASRLDWTIGAAPWVTDDLPVGVYEAVIDASAPGKRLAAADLATFTLDALEQEEWIGHIVGVSN